MKVKEYKSLLNEKRQPVIKETGNTYITDGRKKFLDPLTIYDFCTSQLDMNKCADEYLYVLCLDTAGYLTGLFQASHGSVNASMFPIREIFQKALLLGAVSIILTHNHPSGDVTPSQADKDSTNKARTAGDIVGIRVLDHLIIGNNNYFSFMESGIA